MPDRTDAERPRLSSVPLILIGVAALVAFLVLNGHGYHLLSVAPLLILLACPLMHVFHHGHGGHRHKAERPEPARMDDH